MSGHLPEDISDWKCHMRSYRLNQIARVLTDSSHYAKVKLQPEPDDLRDCLGEFLNTRKQIKSRNVFLKSSRVWSELSEVFCCLSVPVGSGFKGKLAAALLGATVSARRGLRCAELQVCGALSQFATKSVGSGCSPASAPLSLTQQEPGKSGSYNWYHGNKIPGRARAFLILNRPDSQESFFFFF